MSTPSGPTGTITWFGTVPSLTTFRFDVSGRGAPAAETVQYPSFVASVAVTVRTTAVASAGMPACPVICTVMVPLSPGVVAPRPLRVSTSRAGGTGVNTDALSGTAAGAAAGAAEAAGTTTVATEATPSATTAPARA